MARKITPATQNELDLFAKPEVVAALQVLQRNDWLDLDIVELKQFFAQTENHPSFDALRTPARMGGKATNFVMAMVAVALVGALIQTMLAPVMSAQTFVLWGVLGVVLGTVAVRNPARIFKSKR